jgi:S1-C subfamily serine protease
VKRKTLSAKRGLVLTGLLFHRRTMSSNRGTVETIPDGDEALSAVCRIHTTKMKPDYIAPWREDMSGRSSASGFVVQDPRSPAGRLIVTCAHNVLYASDILIQKYNSDVKSPAGILRINVDCDVAILIVHDKKFWLVGDGDSDSDGKQSLVRPLTFGPLPRLQDHVRAVGYPELGSEICVTQGMISRIQLSRYLTSGLELLCVQTDCVINNGNSVSGCIS